MFARLLPRLAALAVLVASVVPSSAKAAARSGPGSHTIVERPKRPANRCPFTFAATPPNIFRTSTRASFGSAA